MALIKFQITDVLFLAEYIYTCICIMKFSPIRVHVVTSRWIKTILFLWAIQTPLHQAPALP
jgi:hypothetical protein